MRLLQQLDVTEVDGDNDENDRNGVAKSSAAKSQANGNYEPLCLQLERNFRLRASDEKRSTDGKPRKLTRPISPNLQVAARKKLRGDSMDSRSETSLDLG